MSSKGKRNTGLITLLIIVTVYLYSGIHKISSIDLDGATVGIENADGTMGVQYRFNATGGQLFSSPLSIEFGADENGLPVELQSFEIK
ncbi:MAG: hypothetical protein JKY19_06930 [Alcanivoracaceae bacterium]|nr:hypothetical protein [Alcanivoracaceae bacterium]